MTVLVISPIDRAAVARLLDFAERSENYYRPYTLKGQIPGDNPKHVAIVGACRCVFTITEDQDGKLWRHLTLSIANNPQLLPNPYVSAEIAHLFEIEGTAEELYCQGFMSPHAEERCVVIGCPYTPSNLCPSRAFTGGRCQLPAGHEAEHVYTMTDGFFQALDDGFLIVGRPPKKKSLPS